MTYSNGMIVGGANSAARRSILVSPQGESQSFEVQNPAISDFDRANNAVLDTLESPAVNYAIMGGTAAVATGGAVVSTLAAGGCAGAAAASGAAALGTFAVVAGAGMAGGYLGAKVGDALFDAVGDDLMSALGYSKVTTEGDAPARLGDAIAHQNKNLGLLGALAGAVAAIAVGALIVATCGAGLVVLAAAAAAGGFVAGAIGTFASKAGQYGTNKGEIASGSGNVFFEGKPVARTEDIIKCSDHPSPQPVIAEGAKTVFVNGRNLARIGHRSSCDANINAGCRTIVTTLETEQIVEIKSSVSNGLRWANIAINFLPIPKGNNSAVNKSVTKTQNKISKILKLGEPVDPTTGDYLQEWPLISLPGSIPIDLTSVYRSTNPVSGLLGDHWMDPWSQRLTLKEHSVHYLNADGSDIEYHTPDRRVYSRHERHKEYILCGERDATLRIFNRSERLVYSFGHVNGDTRWLSRIDDFNGNVIHFHYGAQSQLERISHSDGYQLLISTERGIIRQVTLDGKLPLLNCQYRRRQLVQRKSYQHGTLYHEYNNQGYMTRWYDTDQTDAQIEYDDRGRVLATQTRSGHFSDRFVYDDEQQLTCYHDAEGGVTQVFYDDYHQVRCLIDPAGQATHYQYDIGGDCQRITHPNGQEEVFSYNNDGWLSSHTDLQQYTTDYTYNDLGQATSITQNGQSTHYFYDDRGNLTAVEHPHGKRSTYRYGERGQLHRACLFDGRQLIYSYDEQLNLSRIQEGDSYTGLRFDKLGRLLEIEDSEGSRTTYHYCSEHPGPQSVHYPDGTQERFYYTTENLLSRVQDRQGRDTRYHYGAFDQMTAITQPDRSRIQFQYDRLNRLTGVTNAQGATWRYQYDAAGRLVKESDYSGISTLYAYNPIGQRIGKRVANTLEYQYSYTEQHQLSEVKVLPFNHKDKSKRQEAIAHIHFAYNDQGQLITASNADSCVEFDYNPLGQLTTERINGRAIEHDYDDTTLRPTQLRWGQQTIDYQYALNGALKSLTPAGHDSLHFEYDSLGRETLRQQAGFAQISQYHKNGLLKGQAAGRWNKAMRAQYEHHQDWRHSEWNPLSLEGNSVTRHYHYDKTMNPLKIVESSGTSEFDYNSNDQITQAKFTLKPIQQGGTTNTNTTELPWDVTITEQFDYDNNRQLTQASQHDFQQRENHFWKFQQGAGKTLQRGQDIYRYDKFGRLSEKQIYNKGFRPKTWRYQWNAFDQLEELETPTGECWRYQYDAFGRRLRKFQVIKGGKASNKLHTIGSEFLWSGDQLIEEAPLYADGAVAYDQATQWIYQDDGFTPCLQLQCKASNDSAGSTSELYHIVTDHIGTPRELLSGQGEVRWQRRHSTWGNTRMLASPYAANDDVHCPLVYQGQFVDQESGLHYNRHRYYDPGTAQYLSSDPIGLSGGFYPQAYVHNPNGGVDPLGLAEVTMYHYTSEQGYKSISSQKPYKFVASSPKKGHPTGVYLTDKSPEQLAKTTNGYKKLGLTGKKSTHFFEVKVDDSLLKPIKGDRGKFIKFVEGDLVVDREKTNRHGSVCKG